MSPAEQAELFALLDAFASAPMSNAHLSLVDRADGALAQALRDWAAARGLQVVEDGVAEIALLTGRITIVKHPAGVQ